MGKKSLRKLREAVERKALEAQMFALDNLVDPREPIYDDVDFVGPTGFGGVPISRDNDGRGDKVPAYLNEQQLKIIRNQCRQLACWNEYAINVQENRQSYIVGKGFRYKAHRSDLPPGQISDPRLDPLARAAQAVIDEFLARTRWPEREQECVLRCDRDGEAILRMFSVGGGRTAVRFVEPEHMGEDASYPNSEFGVVTEEGDLEDVKGYMVALDPERGTAKTFVDAQDVIHFKANTDSACKRGLPTLYPVRKNLQRAEDLLRNMSVLAKVQATFAVIRKHSKFSQSAISAYQGAQQDASVTAPWGGRTRSIQQLYPGSIIDTTDGTDITLPSASIDAGGLVGILNAELGAVASCVVMPIYMITGDPSGGNFASTLVAESPSTRNFERWQTWFGRRFGDGRAGRSVLWTVLRNAVAWGLLDRETLTAITIQAEAPTLVVRDKKGETDRAAVLNKNEILSRATWATWEGLDYDQERGQIAKEPKPAPPAGGLPGGGAPEMPQPAPPGSAGGATTAEAMREGCEPNKVGTGHHDSATGHPCSPGGQGGADVSSDAAGDGKAAGGDNKPSLPTSPTAAQRRKDRDAAKADAQRKAAPKSRAYAPTDTIRRDLSDTAKAILGEGGTPEGLHAAIGAQPGSTAQVGWSAGQNGHPPAITYDVSHPDFQDCMRRLSIAPDGGLSCYNQLFFLKAKARGSGLGLKVFSDQVQAMADLGGGNIKTTAGKGGVMNGYYTWPRLGYDCPIPHDLGDKLVRKGQLLLMSQGTEEGEAKQQAEAAFGGDKKPASVLDLMETPLGRAVWKKHGTQEDMKFDISPGSRSLAVLNAYLQSKGKPAIKMDAEKSGQMREARKAAVADMDAARAQEKEQAAKQDAHTRAVSDNAAAIGIPAPALAKSVQSFRAVNPGVPEDAAIRRASYDWMAREASRAGAPYKDVVQAAEKLAEIGKAAGTPIPPAAVLFRQAIRSYRGIETAPTKEPTHAG